MVELHDVMGHHGGSIELLLIPASAPQKAAVCVILNIKASLLVVILCVILNIKASLLLIRVAHKVMAAGFLPCYFSGPLPYVQHYLTCIECVII